MTFFKASARTKFHSIQLLGSSNQKMFLSRPFGNLGASGNGIAKKLFLPSEIFFKVEYLCSLLCLGVHWCSRKKIFEHSEASVLVFYKNSCSENFCILCILSSETSRVEFFLSTLVGLPGITPKSSLEQLFCRQEFIRAI